MMEKYEIQKLRELPIEKVAKEMGMKGSTIRRSAPSMTTTTPALCSARPRTAADAMYA